MNIEDKIDIFMSVMLVIALVILYFSKGIGVDEDSE